MDNSPDGVSYNHDTDTGGGGTLSYDDTVPYEEQLPTAEEQAVAASLKNRIGTAKVYLLSDTSVAQRTGKVRSSQPLMPTQPKSSLGEKPNLGNIKSVN